MGRDERAEMRVPSTSRWPVAGASSSVLVVFVAVLSVPLSAAGELGLSPAETESWIVSVYGLAGVLTLVLVWRFRRPLLLTGNVFILLFIARLGAEVAWSDLVGGAIVGGAAVLVIGRLGLTGRLTRWLPSSIVFGLLAGVVLEFFVRMFDLAAGSPQIVLGTLATYLLARRLAANVIPPILPALVAGLALVALGEGFGAGTVEWRLPDLTVTAPTFAADALVTVAPVMVLLITVQANVPSMVFLRSEGYTVPDRALDAVSGVGTMLGSLLGPTGISLSLPATALCAGPEAGPEEGRHRAVAIAGIGSVAIAVLAGSAVQVAGLLPAALLATIVGLAVFEILAGALRQAVAGPLRIGPVFAFGIAFSDVELLGLGSLFWAIVAGLGISLLLERDAWPGPV